MATVQNVISYLNNNVLGLVFTAHVHKSEINFLGLTLIGSLGCTIKMHTYRKETAGNAILFATSCHPRSVVHNIPTGELLRALRNCSDEVSYLSEKSKIHKRLLCRKYPKWTLQKAENIALKRAYNYMIINRYNRHNEMHHKPKKLFSTAFSSEYTHIKKIVEKHLPILKLDPLLKNISENGFMCVARRAPTFRANSLPKYVL